VVSGFDLITKFALGADACNSARGMMLALGCIQALRCNNNHCPTGVATQNPELVKGLDVTDKRQRVASFHRETVKSAAELMGALGVSHSSDVRPWHIHRRISSTESRHYGEIHTFLRKGDLLRQPLPPAFARAVIAASADSFEHVAAAA
jgi:hypothetical protein